MKRPRPATTALQDAVAAALREADQKLQVREVALLIFDDVAMGHRNATKVRLACERLVRQRIIEKLWASPSRPSGEVAYRWLPPDVLNDTEASLWSSSVVLMEARYRLPAYDPRDVT